MLFRFSRGALGLVAPILALAAVSGPPALAQTPKFATIPSSHAAASDASQCTSFKGQRLYIGSYDYAAKQSSIGVFDAMANGSVKPICTITYPFAVVSGLAVDAGGHLWVVDDPHLPSGSVALLAFAHAANEGAVPLQSISGDKTLLSTENSTGKQGIAIDAAGNVWVPNFFMVGSHTPGGYLTAFTNSANGNVAPVATIGFAGKGVQQRITFPTMVALDNEGNVFYTESRSPGFFAAFAPPFTDRERLAAHWNLPGRQSTSLYIVIDPRDTVYIAGRTTLYQFKGGIKAGRQPTAQFALAAEPTGLATDAQGHVYVAYSDHVDTLPPSFSKYQPTRTIRWQGNTNFLFTVTVGR